jgi:hypothetical protein
MLLLFCMHAVSFGLLSLIKVCEQTGISLRQVMTFVAQLLSRTKTEFLATTPPQTIIHRKEQIASDSSKPHTPLHCHLYTAPPYREKCRYAANPRKLPFAFHADLHT